MAFILPDKNHPCFQSFSSAQEYLLAQSYAVLLRTESRTTKGVLFRFLSARQVEAKRQPAGLKNEADSC